MTRNILGASDHLFSMKVVQKPIVEGACVLVGTPNIRKFIARHGTVKFGSEICGWMAVKLLKTVHGTTHEAGGRGKKRTGGFIRLPLHSAL
jgi:hypothetical protein